MHALLVMAFCGFYVSGAGGNMFNHATQVVFTRVGTRTVLAMQNNYAGPPADFAMVVPVPVVLKEADVKTLPRELFEKVDAMGSPRLVEYWEEDPCAHEVGDLVKPEGESIDVRSFASHGGGGGESHGVTVEAKFVVGEYQILILSAKESTGLDTWLRASGYKIPPNAEPLLRPYVQAGSKFFVAKIDVSKVKFENGMAQLSPLRFHYDTEDAVLPIRLGLANAKDKQDLIVTMLGPRRFEVANFKNVFIPTNLDVRPEARNRFGEFYAALFDRTIGGNPRTAVTEYAWDATSCDPCPGPTLDGTDLGTLGYDVIAKDNEYSDGIVMTRLHLRYGKDDVKDDLVFKQAEPIVGGREVYNQNDVLESKPTPSDYNFFQARYAIRHRWSGPVKCRDPQFGKWGARPEAGLATASGKQIAFSKRDMEAYDALLDRVHGQGPGAVKAKGCGCASSSPSSGLWLVLGLLVLRRKR